jgi:hypothetical protein
MGEERWEERNSVAKKKKSFGKATRRIRKGTNKKNKKIKKQTHRSKRYNVFESPE